MQFMLKIFEKKIYICCQPRFTGLLQIDKEVWKRHGDGSVARTA